MIMEASGAAFARVYWYSDDTSTVYLDSLHVDDKARRQGIGTDLQIMREEIGINSGAVKCFLWVKKDTWMLEWYKRRGYVYYSEHETEVNCVWMIKYLCKCFQCHEDITPENNGVSINNGEFYQCDDCHLIEYGYHLNRDIQVFK